MVCPELTVESEGLQVRLEGVTLFSDYRDKSLVSPCSNID